MQTPVVAADGHTYDKNNILSYIYIVFQYYTSSLLTHADSGRRRWWAHGWQEQYTWIFSRSFPLCTLGLVWYYFRIRALLPHTDSGRRGRIYMYVYIYVCMYIYIHRYDKNNILGWIEYHLSQTWPVTSPITVYICVCMCVCVCTCVHVRTHTHIHTHTQNTQ